jgi:hypothetical protein
MAANKLLSTYELPNGLTLEVWDKSRPVAGDRWQIVLESRICIPVNPSTLPPELAFQAAEVLAALGPELTFARREVRNLIAQSEMAAILAEMESRLLALAPGYLGHPEFAPRFIRQKYQEFLEGQRLNNRLTVDS